MIVLLILLILILICAAVIGARYAVRFILAKRTEGNCMQVYRECSVMLKDKEQIILIEGRNDTLPVMIMYHGGPLTPIIYGESYRGMYPDLGQNYILVWWDQYGCGKNHTAESLDDMTASDWADMAADLVECIHKMYPKNEIYLNGYSFGSYLAMYAADKHKDIVTGVINLSPVMNISEVPDNIYYACEKKMTNEEKSDLEKARRGEFYPYLEKSVALAEKYTDFIDNHKDGKIVSNPMKLKWYVRPFISPDYDYTDIIELVKAIKNRGKTNIKNLNTLGDVDVTDIAESLDLPILYIQGEHELHVLPERLEELAARRSNVKYVKIENCGHIPTAEGWEKILKAMVDFGWEKRRNHMQ